MEKDDVYTSAVCKNVPQVIEVLLCLMFCLEGKLYTLT